MILLAINTFYAEMQRIIVAFKQFSLSHSQENGNQTDVLLLLPVAAQICPINRAMWWDALSKYEQQGAVNFA